MNTNKDSGTSDELGQLIGLAYLLFLGYIFGHIAFGALGAKLSALLFYQIGFAIAWAAFIVLRYTKFELTALCIAFVGLVLNNAGVISWLRGHDASEVVMAAIMAQALFCLAYLGIIHVREGLLTKSSSI